ncbi:putative fasciclin-like arabinogalactan protein 20 [Malus domestica]|uniref:putative fasciclin-like arabinogalactan protein 20 n=1 Tax=Malus domestica TaxID=3750 RepID=UPI00146049EA
MPLSLSLALCNCSPTKSHSKKPNFLLLILEAPPHNHPSMAEPLLVFIILLSLLSFSSALPAQAVQDAAEILSDSGYVSMAMTLELVSESLIPQSPSLTIFAPPDSAFTKSGQPALSLLQYHFCPLPLPLQTLKSLPPGTKIPTLLSGHSLSVTTPPSGVPISLNNVKITSGSPIYDDGFLIIFGIENFFDLNFHLPTPTRIPLPDPVCGSSSPPTSANGTATAGFPGASWFEEASEMLRSHGYNVMASFLDMQLLGFKNSNPMTVFAPLDQAMDNPLQESSIFLRHVVPCRLMWSDLAGFNDGVVLPTYMQGFAITISRKGDVLLLNGVPVFFANMYYGDTFVVHGLRETLVMPETPEDADESSPGSGRTDDEVPFDNTEF